MLRKAIFLILLIGYAGAFFYQERHSGQARPQLSLPLPLPVLKTITGYLRQISGEMHFVKTNVFLGILDPSKPMDEYANSLSANFQVMAELHPHFLDTYFLCESALAHIGPGPAREANAVLAKGIEALPDNWFLPFFKGFNHFYYLKENRAAADDLLAASKLPNGPVWLAHLASMLAAEGGDINAGLIWMKTMLQTEVDPAMQARYQKGITAFEKALAVQKAVIAYRQRFGHDPKILDDIVPDFLSALPDFHGEFTLDWQPPTLKLLRNQDTPSSP